MVVPMQLGEIFLPDGVLQLGVLQLRFEPLLSDQGRHERREDDHGNQHAVLLLADAPVGEPVEGAIDPIVRPVAISRVV